MTYEALIQYLNALPEGEDTLWVTGHPAPDTDAVVSAVFEAFRLTLSGTPARPVFQGDIPREAAWLMGMDNLPTTDRIDPAVPLVLTDHHDVGDYPNPVVSIIDHHPVAEGVNLEGVDATIAPVGAATTLVARCLRADGIVPDPACARILMGAILADTEGLSSYKAKAEDVDAVAWLYALCDVMPSQLEEELWEQLLSEGEATTLYRRDYRLYHRPDCTPYLGWAILKVWADACPDIEAVRRLLAEDTAPTRVAKIVLYHRDDRRTREEYYLAAGERAIALLDMVQSQSGEPAIRAGEDLLYLPADCRHYGRKYYATRLFELFGEK